MSFVKRITATISANLDHAISQIENHDAVVEAALNETRDASARLRVQVSRVKAETRRLHDEIARLESDETRWAERAKRVAAEDEDRALACLRRRRECAEQRADLEGRLERHRDIDRRLDLDLGRLNNRLQEINARRQELRGRELSAKGSRAVADLDRHNGLDVERIFDRWEVEITRSEIGSDVDAEIGASAGSDLADDFERTERDAELREELEALLDQKESDR